MEGMHAELQAIRGLFDEIGGQFISCEQFKTSKRMKFKVPHSSREERAIQRD